MTVMLNGPLQCQASVMINGPLQSSLTGFHIIFKKNATIENTTNAKTYTN